MAIVAIALAAAGIGYSGLAQSPTTQSQPPLDMSNWDPNFRLVVDGSVRNHLSLTLDEIVSMPKSTVNADIICVDYPQSTVAGGEWSGVKLGLILERAELLPEAIKVAFYADDGFTTDLTITTASREDVILAYKLDGEHLPSIRLVVPGKWGYKWIRDLNHIEIVDYDFRGTWESRGYPDDADIPSPQ